MTKFFLSFDYYFVSLLSRRATTQVIGANIVLSWDDTDNEVVVLQKYCPTH